MKTKTCNYYSYTCEADISLLISVSICIPLVYTYDENGSPIGFRYRTHSYAQGVFDGYFFEKNLQGDVIGIWNLIPDASFSISNALLWHRATSTAETIVCRTICFPGFHRLHRYYETIRLLAARQVLSIYKISIPFTAFAETVRPPRYACTPSCARHAL